MPNRLLRDWTASESMDSLSAGAEVLFTRLIMKADDYGSFHGNVKLIKAALFPLKDYTDDQVTAWVAECVKAGLIETYMAESRIFVRIVNFGQRLRNMRSVFPQPADNSPQLAASRSECPPELEENRREVEENTNMKAQKAFDEIYVEKLKVGKAYPGIDIDTQLAQFLEKVRGAAHDYMTHDTAGFRKAFAYQLRNAKPTRQTQDVLNQII